MSYYSSFPAFSIRHRGNRPPALKPGTSPKGTRHATIPHFPTAPSGAYGAPTGGIGHQLNPPRTRGGTPIPGRTYVHQVPGSTKGGSPRWPVTPFGENMGGRDDRFFPGDGRDRGPIPHPTQLKPEGDRWLRHLKTQRGEGHFSDFFRDRIGFGDRHECNLGQHFEDGHHEFRLCDHDGRFISNGIGWSIEEAIENARRHGRYWGDIFDFQRGAFVPFQQFIANPPMLGSGLPVASPYGPSYPPIPQSPFFQTNTVNPFGPPPYDIDTSGRIPTPTPGTEDDGTGTDTQLDNPPPTDSSDPSQNVDTMPAPPPGGGGSGGSTITDKLQQMGITIPMLLIGVGLVAVVLVMKK